MNTIEKIKEKYPLREYVEKVTGMQFKSVGTWDSLEECPFCLHKDCFRFRNDSVICFSCLTFAADSIKFRSLYENLTYKESLDKFKKELNIKNNVKEDEWISIKEEACEYLVKCLLICQTKYEMRGEKIIPLHYLTDTRKHSHEAIFHFRLGFNDGKLVEHLLERFDESVIKAIGIDKIPDGCFTYPLIVDNFVQYFKIKDPNKIKKFQMPEHLRTKISIFYNQDVAKEGDELFITEGEDDVISLWDCGVNAVASCGVLNQKQVSYLKGINTNYIWSCFDNDDGGKRDTNILIKNYSNDNISIIQLPDGKDIDDVIREYEEDDREELIKRLKATAKSPSPEEKSIIKKEPEGYYIEKMVENRMSRKKVTNWIFDFEAVIIRTEERLRKGKIKCQSHVSEVYFDGSVLANVNKLREFLYNNCDKLLFFLGTDNDLQELVCYWDLTSNPKIVKQIDCVGDIDEGFVSENIFVSNNNEIKPLVNGFLELDEKHSIHILNIIQKGGSNAGLPYFPLSEPSGGIKNFKKHIYELLIKNRNLKVALSIGWTKATLFSKMFYEKERYFPLFMLHGKHQGGKSRLSEWMRSMIGLRKVDKVRLSSHNSGIGLARSFAYYSGLPVLVDDYRNDKDCGARYHDFFRGVFDKTCDAKGIKNDFGIRVVAIRGCLLLTGETSPTDSGLLSRIMAIEITEKERNPKYFKEIVQLEPQFACIGYDWLKRRNDEFKPFMEQFEILRELLIKKLNNPRQAEVWAVALASAIIEEVANRDDLIDYTVRLANQEIEERKSEEMIGSLWEAVEVLHKNKKLENRQVIWFDGYNNQLQIHLPSVLGTISGDQLTSRKYSFPNNREVAKILKQEPYVTMATTRVDGEKPTKRWIIDIKTAPEDLQNLFLDKPEGSENEEI